MPPSGLNIIELVNEQREAVVRSSDWLLALQQAINELIRTDFARLVQLLYQADVSEKKLKQLLHQQPAQDAAVIIAGLLLERQLQKLQTRQNFTTNQPGSSTEERW